MNKRLRIIIFFLIVVGILIGIYLFLSRPADHQSFKGRLEEQRCEINIGSSRCTWKVDGKTITWSWGSSEEGMNTGTVEGLDTRNENEVIGKTVEVLGTKTGLNSYSIEKPGEYIRLVQ